MPSPTTLRTAREFKSVLREGRRIDSEAIKGLVLDRQDGQEARIGIIIGRRVGGAVVRNRLRRRIREILRQQVLPNGKDIVIIPRQEAISLSGEELRRGISQIVGDGKTW